MCSRVVVRVTASGQRARRRISWHKPAFVLETGYGSGMEVRGGSSSAALFEMCGRFKKAWIKGGFSWDSRFSCVASSFSSELDSEARAVVSQYFPSEWTMKTVVNAPPQVREVAEATGGVRTDQRLFTGD